MPKTTYKCALCNNEAKWIRKINTEKHPKLKPSYYCTNCKKAGILFGWLEPEDIEEMKQ